jgi:hypothetical protein
MRTMTEKTIKIREKKIAVSEANLRKAASRLLTTKLVSTEVAYIQRELGNTVTQDVMDAKVLAVRAMPWSSIVVPD